MYSLLQELFLDRENATIKELLHCENKAKKSRREIKRVLKN